MNKILKIVGLLLLVSTLAMSQETGYVFTMKKELPCTPVKNQNATSTCWCFSGISMLESEMLRIGKQPYDLSEMYVVRHTYEKKVQMYARMHGSSELAGGGEYGDVLSAWREVGLVPDAAYPGLNYGETKHNHSEMDGAIKGYMDAVIKGSKLTTAWFPGLNGILDAYLGKMPENFTYEGKSYTPATFTKELGINPDDYVLLTSFSHHPFYKQCMLELPDNWAGGTFYNLPLDDLMQVIDNSLMNGYTVAWASDMSDKGFSMKQGVAIIPEKNWNEMNEEELSKIFTGPHPEKVITQELRQKDFDNYTTTDDHGMHIIGLATDQAGNTFYKVKNSWGVVGKYDGFIFVSKPFVMLRTTNIMVNKNAIPAAIAKKLGL
ncbi:MAG TPA: C1 family peptidase [Bacteroidales bacterium]|nr:C1 family peptidase [Bacteroidales bacterium]